MNKNCYRHVFNKKRGIIMVVSEILTTTKKSPSAAKKQKSNALAVKISPIKFAVQIALSMVLVPINSSANIIADPSAPNNQQAIILQAPNKVPLINIQTPSKAGLSHNTYKQFDVSKKGAIINNSRNNSPTKLGGWVQGNPSLANGSAKIILNEVNSSTPSQLNGFVEIAGQKAQIVIANPAGITCTDCGFINANKATLTTGSPVINHGNLIGYSVTSGELLISGKSGLKNENIDYTDLIAQSVRVNSSIWAEDLRIITGTNEISIDNSLNTKETISTSQPAYALDVSELGGMYAGKISIIGTQHGVGVRNYGTIGANAGEVKISAEGKIENFGSINSVEKIKLTSNQSINNSGLIYAKKDLNLTADSSNSSILKNKKYIPRTDFLVNKAPDFESNIAISEVNNVTNNGNLLSDDNITIQANDFNNENSTVQALSNIDFHLKKGNLNNKNGLIRSNKGINITANKLINTDTDSENKGIKAKSLTLNIADSINNNQGQIKTNQHMKMQVGKNIDNTKGIISSSDGSTSILDSDLTNKQLKIVNTSGNISTGQDLLLSSLSLTSDGTIQSNDYLEINLINDFLNYGLISSAGHATINAANKITNHSTLQGNQNLNIFAQSLNNVNGAQISASNLKINTSQGTTDNYGLINSNTLNIDTNTLKNIGSGKVYADEITIKSNEISNDKLENNSAVIAAREKLTIDTNTLSNKNYSLIFSAGDLAIGKQLNQQLQFNAKASVINNESATIEALGNMELNAELINNNNLSLKTEVVASEPTRIIEWKFNKGPYVANRYSNDEVKLLVNYREKVEYLMVLANGFREDKFTKFDFQRTQYQTVVTETNPAKILSSNNLTINANTLNNDKSQIIAGQSLAANIDALYNIAANGNLTTKDEGKSYYFRRKKRDHPTKDRTTISTSSYTPASIVTNIDIAQPIFEVNNFTSTDTQIADYQNNTNSIIIENLNAFNNDVKTITLQEGEQLNLQNLPNNSLFIKSINANQGFIIETDPQFANYRKWLSSNYLLDALQINPSEVTARLGDGFYEQQLLREQMAQLTGQRFLQDFDNEESQYQYLMQQGALFADKFNLTPGIALTSEQMAQLTTDMVWLVEKTVTLADGTTTQAMVPQLYALVRNQDISTSGALLSAGKNINLNLTDNLQNMGTIAGRDITTITSENINNLGGTIQSANLDLNAQNDINNIGGTIKAKQNLNLNAGHNIRHESTTSTQTSSQGHQTNINRMAALYVSDANGLLNATAGANLLMKAANIKNAGTTNLTAGENIVLSTLTKQQKNKVTWNKKNYSTEFSNTEVGNQIESQQGIQISAGKNINIHASSISSEQGTIDLNAKQDVNLSAGKQTIGVNESFYSKNKGIFSSSSEKTSNNVHSTQLKGTILSATEININSGNTTKIEASELVAENHITINAGENIAILSAKQQEKRQQIQKKKQSGLMSSRSTGLTLGSQKQSDNISQLSTTQIASTIGSLSGDVTLKANNDVKVQTSEVLAQQGNIDIQGANVSINTADNSFQQTEIHKFTQSGISVGLSGGAIDSLQTLQHSAQRIPETDNGKLKLLHAWKIKQVADNLPDQISDLKNLTTPNESTGLKINVSIGSSNSKQTRKVQSTSAQGSSLIGGGNIKISATSTNPTESEGSINSQGSLIQANNVSLNATQNINLNSTKNTHQDTTKSKNSSHALGASFGSKGVQVYAQASTGKANTKQTNDQFLETTINANNNASLQSGNNTTLKGAQVHASSISADIGGNLAIISQQDQQRYKSQQNNQSVKIGVGLTPNTPITGNLNASELKAKANYQSVQQQSGLFAGKQGFDINVEKNTHLTGGAIISEADAQNNQLTTATLTSNNLRNKSSAEVKSTQNSFSSDMLDQGKYTAAKIIASNTLLNADNKDKQSAQTLSTISKGNIQITDQQQQIALTGKTSTATLNQLNTDTTKANQTLTPQDIQSMQESVAQASEYQQLLYQEAIKFTDETYRTMFLKKARIMKVLRNKENGQILTKDGKPQYIELSEEEKNNLKPGASGKINVFTNGIFNDIDSAADYAVQNSEVPAGEDVYLVYFPEADNFLSELLVAAYQKHLEGGAFDLANATQETKQLMQQYGESGLYQVGHSRGTLTIGNAMTELQRENQQGVLQNTSIRYVGPADNAADAANKLYDLSNGNSVDIELQNHADDWVGTMIGNNEATYDKIPENSNRTIEKVRVVTGDKPTVHSCYGSGDNQGKCEQNYGKAKSIRVESTTWKEGFSDE